MSGPKETVHDAEIVPLMAQIIDICNRHKIAMVADFALDEDDDGQSLSCTTALLDESHSPTSQQKAALRMLYATHTLSAFTITTGEAKQ